MSRLRPEKLHVEFGDGVTATDPICPRRYTLTHSDATGDLYLTISEGYSSQQVSGWYVRLMRDEVLAEWRKDKDGPALHVFCHVSGGLALGAAGWRDAIFRRELPLVLEALRHGDSQLFAQHPHLNQTPIWVHFQSTQSRYHRVEQWGTPGRYRG